MVSEDVVASSTFGDALTTSNGHCLHDVYSSGSLGEDGWKPQKKSKLRSSSPAISSTPPEKEIRSSIPGACGQLIVDPTATWSQEKEKILFGPFDYMLGHPGKDIRGQLIEAFNSWLQVPEESLAIISKVVGMLHTASLL